MPKENEFNNFSVKLNLNLLEKSIVWEKVAKTLFKAHNGKYCSKCICRNDCEYHDKLDISCLKYIYDEVCENTSISIEDAI